MRLPLSQIAQFDVPSFEAFFNRDSAVATPRMDEAMPPAPPVQVSAAEMAWCRHVFVVRQAGRQVQHVR